MIFLWLSLYVLALVGGLVLNLFGFAGNWVIFGASIGYYFAADASSERLGIGLGAVLVLGGLALLGEALEFLASMLGAGKVGGSRRGMLLSMLGGLVGSIFGFSLGNLVIPLLGGIIGIVMFAGVGALVGAVLGECWKGKGWKQSVEVGKAAMIGRILGTLGKGLVGSVMVIVGGVALLV